jgi:hypothetical protein
MLGLLEPRRMHVKAVRALVKVIRVLVEVMSMLVEATGTVSLVCCRGL